MRIMKSDPPDQFQGGRWKEQHVMPLRYALETKFVVMIDIIVRVTQACVAAMQRVPLDQ